MFCQGAPDLWGTESLERTFFALPGLQDASRASPGAPSRALWPLWVCLARRPVLVGRLLGALGRPTWLLNCQTAVQKLWQVAPSADVCILFLSTALPFSKNARPTKNLGKP